MRVRVLFLVRDRVLLRVRLGLYLYYRLIGLVVKVSACSLEDPGFDSNLRHDFFPVESYR